MKVYSSGEVVCSDGFEHPQEEFTPIPFWFWNDELDKAEIMRRQS